MNVKFKIATLGDVDEIIKLCNECFFENTSIEYARKVFSETNKDDNQIYLIGEVDNKIVAHTKITIIPTIFDKIDNYAILNHICVKREYRHSKIALKMLDECEKIAKKHNCKCIDLWSKNFRKNAQKCYLKNGFDKMDATFFTKNLD